MFFETLKKGDVIYRSLNGFGTPHGFSTRFSGVSTEEHLRSLNLGFGRGECDENVEENYRIFLDALGLDPKSRASGEQTHSTNVQVVSKTGGVQVFSQTDGLVTGEQGVSLIVKIADCAPVLLYDPENHVIGALHCGWRGAAKGMCAVGVEKMRALGADPKKIRVAIGACIHDCCFEVKEDFKEELTSLAGKDFAKKYIRDKNGVMYADLVGINLRFLHEAGVDPKNVCVDPLCTCCDPKTFFSHRATKGIRGTMCAVISQ